MSASCFTQGYHVYTICPNVIFQILLPCSRPMILHHVTCQCDCNVTCLFIVQKKIKKGKEYKIDIKSEKLTKKKEKLSVSKAFHNIEGS